KENC
ncbi:hypothetical protein VN97_g2424, partial [Penicillium thymicola]